MKRGYLRQGNFCKFDNLHSLVGRGMVNFDYTNKTKGGCCKNYFTTELVGRTCVDWDLATAARIGSARDLWSLFKDNLFRHRLLSLYLIAKTILILLTRCAV